MIEWYCCSASCRHSRLVCIDGGGGARSRGGEPSGYSYRRSGFKLRLGFGVQGLEVGAWSTSSKEQQRRSLIRLLSLSLAHLGCLPLSIDVYLRPSPSIACYLSLEARAHTHTHTSNPHSTRGYYQAINQVVHQHHHRHHHHVALYIEYVQCHAIHHSLLGITTCTYVAPLTHSCLTRARL